MTVAIALWLALVVCLAVITASVGAFVRNSLLRLFVVLAFWTFTIGNFFAMQQALGRPDHDTLPPGEYKVLGARIDVDVAIYAMLDDGSGEPHLYRLPYTTGQANALQDALDATAGGQAGGAGLQQSDSPGEPQFFPIPVQPNPPKAGESPMVEMP